MPAVPLPCCVDVPSEAAGLVRYGLTELLWGLGLRPAWTRRDEARLVVSTDAPEQEGGGRVLAVSSAALSGLGRPRRPDLAGLGHVELEGERWPLPVSVAGSEAEGDVVASAAWWLAGLQEHAVAERDRHGRFPYTASLQAQLGEAPGGSLRPAVDAYRRWLAGRLSRQGAAVPGRTWGGATWAVALTHDLDAVRTRRLRALVGDAVRGRAGFALRRALAPDVRWQSVLDLRALADRHGIRSTWFVKPGAWAPEDVPHRLDCRYCTFLRSVAADGHEVGWHPGYGAHDHEVRLATERARFERATGHPPKLARTHFLRWAEPATPRLLQAQGVVVDSTLGFSHHEGFRRGTAHPFRLYDVAADRPTDLWEVPLAVMDTTLSAHRRLSPEGLHGALQAVLNAARESGGCAVVLWHNDMGEGEAWRRRLRVLDHCIGQARRDGAVVGAVGALLETWESRP